MPQQHADTSQQTRHKTKHSLLKGRVGAHGRFRVVNAVPDRGMKKVLLPLWAPHSSDTGTAHGCQKRCRCMV